MEAIDGAEETRGIFFLRHLLFVPSEDRRLDEFPDLRLFKPNRMLD